jgi:hypothetical protein
MGASLRVTKRCLVEDLGLAGDASKLSIEELAEQNSVVASFLDKRGQDPEGVEKVQPLTSNVVVHTLHAGEYRGATWHDRRAGAVWLLAARFHRSGQRDDAYPYFKELDATGRLLPTREDYDALVEAQTLDFAGRLLEEIPPIRERVKAEPGTIFEAVLGGRVVVRAVYEDDDSMMTIAISQNLLPGETPVPPSWQLAIAAGFLPHTTPPENLSFAADLAEHELRGDEIAYCDFEEEE